MTDFSGEDGWPTFSKTGWYAPEFDAEQGMRAFTPRQLELLVELVEKTKSQGLDVTEITRDVFAHPEMDDVFVDWVQRFKNGQGLLKLSGFPVRDLPEDDIWRMYWGIGAHFGIGVSQDRYGHLQGKVTVQPGVVGDRVYGTAKAAGLHADRIDVLSLLCINKAVSGGENIFCSLLKVWELIEAERQDLFELLKSGYPQARNGEEPEGAAPVTPYRVPIFGSVNGLRSAYLGGNGMLSHQEKHFADMLTDADREALTYLAQVLERKDVQLHQTLEPGEAVFINNMELAHSRAAFVDGEEPHQRRLLLRLWLQGRPMRPLPRDMRVIHNPDGNLGIWPKAVLEAAA